MLRPKDLGGIIVTDVFPPVPFRRFDYCATRADYEPPMPIGHGATPAEAICDLLNAEETYYDD